MFDNELSKLFTNEEIFAFYEFNKSRKCAKLENQDYWYVYDLQIFINTQLTDERKAEIICIATTYFPQLVGFKKELL